MARRELPPLNGLRAFEAAARHGSFKVAAEELGVTPGAISQQVKSLEDRLGATLFERAPQSIQLAPAARDLASTLTKALDDIEAGLRRLRLSARPEIRLHISCPAGFATNWLMSRLAAFHRHAPEIVLTVSATERLVEPAGAVDGGDVEACVRLGRAGWSPQFGCDFLFLERRLPVCSPDYAARHPIDPESRSTLDGHTLLEAIPLGGVWNEWLNTFRSQPPSAKRLAFGDERLAQQGALAGLGIALVDRTLVEDELTTGRLIAPLPSSALVRGHAWYFVYPAATGASPALARFRAWLQDAIGGEVM